MKGARALAVNLFFLPFAAWWTTWFGLVLGAVIGQRSGAGNHIQWRGTTRFDVLVPAANEDQVLPALLDSLRRQTAPSLLNRVLVVADNCSDMTAGVARSAGFEALERLGGDSGKQRALRDGLTFLASREDRADVVVVIDADCVCEPDFLAQLSLAFVHSADAVQAVVVIEDPKGGAVRTALRLSYGLRGRARASGADHLGLPVLLFGTGMAFRWHVIEQLSLRDPPRSRREERAPAGIDVAMWLDLLSHGTRPRLAENARLITRAPYSLDDLAKQRLRWERGQVRAWRSARVAIAAATRRHDWPTVLALVDWSAPPLAPTVFAFTSMSCLSCLGVVVHRLTPRALVIPAVAATSLVGYIAVGTTYLEGPGAAARLFAFAPKYLMWKALSYLNAAGHQVFRKRGEESSASKSSAPDEVQSSHQLCPPSGATR